MEALLYKAVERLVPIPDECQEYKDIILTFALKVLEDKKVSPRIFSSHKLKRRVNKWSQIVQPTKKQIYLKVCTAEAVFVIFWLVRR